MSAGMRAGQLLLIHGGGSGIGTHAIQVAVAHGVTVAVTAGSEKKLDRCRELGASLTINYRDTDFVESVRKFGSCLGADIILDNLGAAYLDRNIVALAPDCQLVIIGMQGGRTGELDLANLLSKRGTVRATSLRGRPTSGVSSKAEIVAAVTEKLWPLVANGTVKPVAQAKIPIAETATGHQLLDSPETVGKVVLLVR